MNTKLKHGHSLTEERKRILIVEDEQAFLDLLTHTLESEKFVVDKARSSAEAIALLDRGGQSLVLLDWDLSRGSQPIQGDPTGRSVLAKCRELNPWLAVIVMSGAVNFDVRHDAILGQADSFLQKPFSIHLLVKHVFRWLQRTEAVGRCLYPRDKAEIIPLDELQSRYARRVVELLDGNVTQAAKALGVHRHTASVLFTAGMLGEESIR